MDRLIRFSGVARTTVTTAGAGVAGIVNPHADKAIWVRSISIVAVTAVVSQIGFYVADPGVPVWPPPDFIGEWWKPSTDLGSGSWAFTTSWAADPTPASPLKRKVIIPATVGAGIVWEFDKEEFGIQPAGPGGSFDTLYFRNDGLAACALLDITVDLEGPALP